MRPRPVGMGPIFLRAAGRIPKVIKSLTSPEASNTESAPYRAFVREQAQSTTSCSTVFEIEALGDAAADLAHPE